MFSPTQVARKVLRTGLGLSAVLSCGVLPALAQKDVCKMMNLGHLPGATVTFATGVNASGRIVGVSGTHAFLYANSKMKNIGTLGGANSAAYGINRSNQIVGNSDTKSGVTHAFLYEGGVMKDLGTLGGANSFAYGINDLGQVVGQAQTTSGAYHAFLYQHGYMTDLGSFAGDNSVAYRINNNGLIVGSSYVNATDFHAFSYDNGVMKDLGNGPGMTDSEAFGVNDLNEIVGYTENADASQVRGFLYKNGALTELGTLGGNASFGADINKHQIIAGYSTLGDGNFHSTVYVPRITFDLGTLPGDVSSFALAMNNSNEIVGYSSTATGESRAYACKFTGGDTDNDGE